jgi:Uncharacterised nucleotidyltransferase
VSNPRNPRLKMNHNPEHELLLCIARRQLDPSLLHDLNWDYLFNIAQAHGLLPLLHKHLSNTDLVPGHFRSRLKQAAVANSQNVLHLVGKQLRLYKLFKEHDIPVALFKGPLLAQMAYGELSLRQAGDIDLLIHRQNFVRAKMLLDSLGYQMHPKLTRAQLDSHLAFHCELSFMRDDWFTLVDLHWDLAPRSFVFRLKADEVMSRLQTVSLAGTPVETFSTEDLVLYESMHGAKHLWRRLEWITALAETLRVTSAINWHPIVERAGQARATRMLALGLRLVELFSGATVPSHVMAAVDRDGSMQRMAVRIRKQIFTTHGPADSSETNRYNLRIMDRKRDALTSALHAIFVPTLPDWQALTLPPSLHSLYYAFRPLRLSKIYSTSLLQRATRLGPNKHNA